MILLNGRIITVTKFPNNEALIRDCITDVKDNNMIDFKFESNEDFLNLMFIKKHIDMNNPKAKTKLLMPYMPYSRMDRTEGKNIFTLKYICELINSLQFDEVEILEPHSEVCIALLDRVKITNMSANIVQDLMDKLKFKDGEDFLFYPDAGAEKRYIKQIKYNSVLSAQKERDFLSGNIKKMTITGELPTKPFRVIIVDDLCSKGGTFMLGAEKLKEIGATEIYLVITHCENTILDGDVLKTDLIKEVHTTDSIIDTKLIPQELLNNKLNIMKIF
jgi:ribose-phosphate pyrophosphokinase